LRSCTLSIRLGVTQQGRVDGAQRHRQVGPHLVGDAEVVRDLDHPRHADLLGHAHGHEVARLLEAVAHRYRAERLLVAVVARPPDRLAVAGVEFERGVEHDAAGREAGIHRGKIDERLEGRAGLALGLDGPVELAHAVGPTP
jgi:hypothetical protein